MACRICTSNDVDSLAERLAERMWDASRDRAIDPEWPNAGPYWQGVLRRHALEMIKLARNG